MCFSKYVELFIDTITTLGLLRRMFFNYTIPEFNGIYTSGKDCMLISYQIFVLWLLGNQSYCCEIRRSRVQFVYSASCRVVYNELKVGP